MKLRDSGMFHLRSVVYHLLEQEERDYYIWCKEGNDPKNHIYANAAALSLLMDEHERDDSCCEEQAKKLRETEDFFTDTESYDRKVL